MSSFSRKNVSGGEMVESCRRGIRKLNLAPLERGFQDVAPFTEILDHVILMPMDPGGQLSYEEL
jgi:hypothetical protein